MAIHIGSTSIKKKEGKCLYAFEEMFPRYYMHSKIFSRFISSPER